MSTPAASRHTFSERLPRAFLALTAVVVLYVLSCGPAYAVALRWSRPGVTPLTTFYTPLFVVAGKTSKFQWLTRYVLWWTRQSVPGTCQKFGPFSI